MFKLLEKKPFVRWKFVQQIVHKHRMSKRTGSNRYKTFSKGSAINDTEEFLNAHSSSESVGGRDITTTTTKSPFNTRRKLDEANANIGILPNIELDGSPKLNRSLSTSAQQNDMTLQLEERTVSVDSADQTLTDNTSPTASPDTPVGDEIETIEDFSIQKADTKHQYNPLSFQRTSKLRNSFKALRRKSSNQLNSARESMKRQANSRKYENLDDDAKAGDDEEIVNYDYSPGSRRRAQFTRGESFRKSLKHSGKYILAGMQQIPAAAIAQGINGTTMFPTKPSQ